MNRVDVPYSSWDLLADMWLRTTGFPFAHLQKLRLREVPALLERWEADIAAVGLLAPQFWSQINPQLRHHAAARTAGRIREAVVQRWELQSAEAEICRALPGGAEWTEQWQNLAGTAVRRLAEASDCFDRELGRVRNDLWELAADGRFQEAVLLNSPDAFRNLGFDRESLNSEEPPHRNAGVRKAEGRLYSYLQRLCAKNDTVSFFGPLNFASVDEQAPENIRLRFREGREMAIRQVAYSHWGTEAIARAMLSDPRVQPYLPVRLNPLVRRLESGRVYFHLVEKEITLPAQFGPLLDLLDQPSTAEDLAERSGTAVETIVARLQALAKAQIVLWGFSLHPCLPQPLHDLRRQCEGLPGPAAAPWLAVLDEVEELRRAFEAESLPRRPEILTQLEAKIQSVTGGAQRRKLGQGYGDRLLLAEDCLGDVEELVIGGDLARRIRKAADSVFPLLMALSQAERDDVQSVIRPVWQRLAESTGKVSYTKLLRELEEINPFALPLDGKLARLRERLLQLVEQVDNHTGRLHPEALRSLAAEAVQVSAERPDWQVFPSPDLLIAARSVEAVANGDCKLVFGEVHDTALSVFGSYLSSLHPEAEQLFGRLESHVRSRPLWERTGWVISQRRHKHYEMELPGFTVELAPFSTKHRELVVPIAEVAVEEIEGELVLTTNGKPFYLWPGNMHAPAFLAFSLPCVRLFPVEMGAHTPRLMVDDVVIQRESWRFAAADWLPGTGEGEGLKLVRHMRRLQVAHGLPDWVFVRYEPHEKPLLVDFANPLALEQLLRHLKPGRELVMSEMLPDPEHLWWPGPWGPQTCEFRIAVYPSLAAR